MGTDIVGYDDLVGAEEALDALVDEMVEGTDIIGALQRRRQRRGGGGGGLQRRQRVQAQDLPISFVGAPVTNIGASSTGTPIQLGIQRDIRPDDLIIPRTVITAGARVVDMRVGTISLNASQNPAPGDAFAPDCNRCKLRAVVTATPSVGIQLTIANSTAVAFDFECAIFGPSAPA